MKRGHVPVRMCAICRRRMPQDELTRHTGRIGVLCPDEGKRRSGRGWYVCAQERCLEKLARRGAVLKQRAGGFPGGYA